MLPGVDRGKSLLASRVRFGIVGIATGALAGIGLAAWIATDFRDDLAQQRARIAASGSRLVPTRCGPIEVAEAGPAQGLAVLVVHGSGGGFDQGLALGADLALRGFRVIAPSRLGYLRTPWPATLATGDSAAGEAQAEQFACLLDAMGLGEVALMGVSAGAISATEFAARHPQRTKALVLMVPAAYRPDPTPPLPGWAQVVLEGLIAADLPFWLAARFAPDQVRRFVMAAPPAAYAAASEDEKRRADRLLREIAPIGARRRGLLHDTLATQRVPRPRFEAIRAPTLAISARDDFFGTLASAAHAAQQIPGARLLVFDRGGHLLLNHQPEVTAAIETLLRPPRAGP